MLIARAIHQASLAQKLPDKFTTIRTRSATIGWLWCPGPESNWHDSLSRGILSPLRLPIPPPGHKVEEQLEGKEKNANRITESTVLCKGIIPSTPAPAFYLQSRYHFRPDDKARISTLQRLQLKSIQHRVAATGATEQYRGSGCPHSVQPFNKGSGGVSTHTGQQLMAADDDPFESV